MSKIVKVEAIVGGITEDGEEFRGEKWEFTSLPPMENDYGNGIYIRVEHDGRFHVLLDVRYGDPDLMLNTEMYLNKWYGDNMKQVSFHLTYEK